jgi:hypothetical protein
VRDISIADPLLHPDEDGSPGGVILALVTRAGGRALTRRRPTVAAVWAFSSLRGYRRPWMSGDLVAGLTVWAVLVPEALAYATIAAASA